MLFPTSIKAITGSDITFKHFAWLTVLASVALSLVGVYAIDLATSLESKQGASNLVGKQGGLHPRGMLAAAVVSFPHHRFVRMIAWPSMWLVLALLVFLLLPFVPQWLVTPRNGARAWINVGPIDFQPGEVAKIAVVLVLADYFRYRKNHRTILGLVPPALITFVPVALITPRAGPRHGHPLRPCLFAMLVAAGARLKHLASIVLIGILAGPAAYPMLKPHQKERIVGLINMVQGNPEGADDINYQSLTAVRLAGAGQLEGMPEEKSRAVIHFNHLPERHNDMIFAVIVNRFGMLGGLAVLGLYAVWFLGAFLTAATCKDPFGRLMVVGFAALIAAQDVHQHRHEPGASCPSSASRSRSCPTAGRAC